MKKILSLLTGFMVFLGGVSYAQTQITGNVYQNIRPSVDGNNITWRGYDGTDWEVFHYDTTTGMTTQVTNNIYDDAYMPSSTEIYGSDMPRVNQGLIAWSAFDGMDREIFVYNTANGVLTQVTNNSVEDLNPRIDAGNIVWVSGGLGGSPQNEVYLYNVATGVTTQITNNAFADMRPRISNGMVSWLGFDGMDNEVFIYDNATGVTTQISNNSVNDTNNTMGAGIVAWQSMVNATGEIFVYDISTGSVVQATNNASMEEDLDIDDIEKVVEWSSFDGTDYEIYLYDAVSGSITQVTNNTSDDIDGWVSGKQLVWSGFDGMDTEVYYYNMNDGKLLQISNNDYPDYVTGPRIQGGRIVWAGCPTCVTGTEKWEIFVHSLAIPLLDIKANGSDTTVRLAPGARLLVDINLDAATLAGTPVDIWVAAATPAGTFWYTSSRTWAGSSTPIRAYGGPLVNLKAYQVLDSLTLPIALPKGPAFFYFAVDNNADNLLDATWWDYVPVLIE